MTRPASVAMSAWSVDLARSFERHLRSENTADRTVETNLAAVTQLTAQPHRRGQGHRPELPSAGGRPTPIKSGPVRAGPQHRPHRGGSAVIEADVLGRFRADDIPSDRVHSDAMLSAASGPPAGVGEMCGEGSAMRSPPARP